LLKNKFETVNYLPLVKAKIAIIEVENDVTIPRYHLEKLLEAMPSKPLHIILSNTTHGKILEHPAFTKELQTILGKIIE
jgi:homoserine acetyltransferase